MRYKRARAGFGAVPCIFVVVCPCEWSDYYQIIFWSQLQYNEPFFRDIFRLRYVRVTTDVLRHLPFRERKQS